MNPDPPLTPTPTPREELEMRVTALLLGELSAEEADAFRAQMAADLERLPVDAWTREAIHTETGLVTLRGLLLHSIRHLEHHTQAIRDKRLALGV